MKFSDFLSRAAIIKEVSSSNRKEVIKELVEAIKNAHNLRGFKTESIVEALMKREKLGSTGIGNGVAVPHTKLEGLKDVVASFGRSSMGIDFNAVDGEPVHLIFLILTPADKPEANLQALQRVSQAIKQTNFCKFLAGAKETKDIFDLLKEADEVLK